MLHTVREDEVVSADGDGRRTHMKLLPFSLSVLCVSLGLVALAQSHPYGCHYFRHTPGPITYPAGAREQIDETIARSDTFDILHYDISLDVTTFSGSSFVAHTAITFVPLMADQAFIRFDLFELEVDSVVGAGGIMPFTYNGQFLKVDFAAPPTVGEQQELTVYYHGAPHRDPDWGGFYFESGYIYNLGIGLTTIPPNFGKVWYPCFDSFVERATYTYHVKSAGTNRLHGQGDLLGEEQLGGDTVITSFDLPQSIPTHLSAVAISAYTDHDYVHTGVNGDIPVRLTAKANNLPDMIANFGDLGAAIDACEHWYGPYAYGRVGYVLTTDGALEIPTNVAYPQFMTGQPIADNRRLFTHELGHHWWGDVVTPRVHNDMWLKEGPAEYSAHLIEEWLGGQPALIKAVKDNHYDILRTAHLDDGGFQPLSPMPDPYIYGTHTYYKGASVMHNLRGYLGDELFQQALRGVQLDLANTDITAVGFKEALEAQTGADLDPFFDAWVFAPGYSAFEVRGWSATPNGSTWDVGIDVGQKLRGATVLHEQVPLDVTFISASGEVDEQTAMVGGLLTTLDLEAPFEPAMVVLNRSMRLNQARMDHEITLVPGESFSNLLPYVDFRLYGTNLVDSTLVRVDHIWSDPDEAPLAPDILQIGKAHYWNVDGLWPEGTVLEGRMYYAGGEGEFDEELVNGDETGMSMLYRATANEEWTVYPDQTVTAGNLTNGTGLIKLEPLRKGQYAFGKAVGTIGVAEVGDRPFSLELMPNPASQNVVAQGELDGQATLWWDVIGADGRLVQRTTTATNGAFRHTLDVSGLAIGTYVLRIRDARGSLSMERRFQVAR